MATHFATKRRFGLGHFDLDQRIAGFPHHRHAADALDFVEQGLRGFNIGDDRRTGAGFAGISCA